MKKLIKLSKTHYIIVDESEIKKGDPALHDFGMGYEIEIPCDPDNLKSNTRFKITHSTQPLEHGTEPFDNGVQYQKIFNKIRPLSLPEVEELIYGYSVEKLSESANGYSVYGKPLGEKYLAFNEGYQSGFNAHKELVKDKLFTIEDIIQALKAGFTAGADHSRLANNPMNLFVDKYINQLSLKTEWEVEFENDKLKLICQKK